MVYDIEVGDFFIIGGIIKKVACKDKDSDLWVDSDSIEDASCHILGSVLIGSMDRSQYDPDAYSFFSPLEGHLLEPEVEYAYMSRRTYVFLKLNLTKLLKKMYNIPDEYAGNVYSVKRRTDWRN